MKTYSNLSDQQESHINWQHRGCITVAGMHDKSLVVAKPGFFQRYAHPPHHTSPLIKGKATL